MTRDSPPQPTPLLPNYDVMARVYDRWMAREGTPYDDWSDFIAKRFAESGISVTRVLDVGCGTGNLMSRLQDRGYDVTGVDASHVMLATARHKLRPHTVLVQSKLPDPNLAGLGPFQGVVAVFDVVNYLVTPGAFRAFLGQVSQLLEPAGIFVFDVNTRLKLEEYYGDHHYGDDYDDFAYIWRSRYDTTSAISDFLLTFFVKVTDGYTRWTEHHQERWYSHDEIRAEADRAALDVLQVVDNYSTEDVSSTTLRETWVLRRS